MPDTPINQKQQPTSTPAPTKAQLAGYIRSINKTAAGLSDDEILDKLVSAQPKIGKLVSDYSNPLIQGPVPLKNQLPLFSDVEKSVMKTGQAQPLSTKKTKSVQEEFNDVEVLRAKAKTATYDLDTPMQPGQLPVSSSTRKDVEKFTKQGDEAFKKFQVRYNQDPEIQSMKSGAISNLAQFTAKDNLGSTYVDNAKLRKYIRTKMPQAANTQFEDYMVSNFGADIMFETKKPELQKTILKKAKEQNIKIPENFLDLNKDIAKNAQLLSDNVTKKIQNINNEATTQIQTLNSQYKSTVEQIRKKYSDKAFVQQNFKTEEEFRAAYEKEVGDAFDNYSRNFSTVNARYKSLSSKLKGDYERSMKTLEATGEQQRASISKLMKESLIDMNEADNNKRLAIYGVENNFNPFTSTGSTWARSAVSGLANWLDAQATNLSIGSNSQLATDFKDFASNLSKKLKTPSTEIKSFRDLLDPDKFAISSGVMIGQMLPAIGAAVATRGVFGGGLGTALTAGTLQWYDEASQARASNYNSMLEQGLDPEEAKNRSNKTYTAYLATLPLSMIEAGAMFGKFGKGSLLRRYAANVGAEIPSETLQELIQNESDEAIVNNRKFDFGKAFNIGNVYKTGLNVAPASIVMPIPGSAMESSRENEAISQTANWALRVTTAPIQSMANNITKNGLFANIASLEAMRHNGMISEEGLNGMRGMLNEVNSDMETSKASGLNKKQQSVYAGLMGNVRNLQDAVTQIESQEMTEEARKEAIEIANKRLNNAREVAADYLNTKNGNYAEIVDKDGDKYIVSHDELGEMLGDESFRSDVQNGNARVQLNYNKKAGEKLGELSKTLLSLNKNFNEGLREYNQSEKQLNALRKKLNIPEQPTSSTTIDGLIGQRVTYRVNKFPVRINMTGILGVQNGNLVLDTEDGGVVKLGKASEMTGMMPSDLNIEFEPQRYQGPKMTQQQAKLPSLLAMFAGKIDPKTLSQILSDVISDVKKSEINKMVKAFDSAYQRRMQQKAINESLPKPAKQIDVVEPEIGQEYDGNEVSEVLAQVGDKSAKSFFDKIMSFSLKDFVATTIDLDDLFEESEEFRNRVEQERGEKKDRFVSEYSNTERVPAVVVNGKVADGMGRLARLYVNGDKVATVFENIKTKKDATTTSQGQIQEGGTTSDIGQREGVEIEQEQETAQADTSNRNISSQKVQVEPAIARITSDNIEDVTNIPGNKVQRKVLNDVKKVVLAIKDLVKESIGFDIEVNVHNQESFTKAVLEIGGTKQQSVARGFYMSSNGTIHINLDTATSETMMHEGFHPILDYLAAKNPLFIEKMYKQLSSIPEAISSIEQAIEGYKGETNQKKEAITDFVAGIADGRIILNPSNFQKIKNYVLNLLNKIGIGQGGSKLMNVTNENELIKLAKFVTEKFRSGEVVTAQGLNDAMNKPSGYQDKFGRIITNGKAQFSLNNDFSDVKTKTTFSYLKNDSEFERLKQSGYITEDKTLDDFVGKKMMLHAPDNAFTGQILKNGEILVEGKGGVFYPVRFHEDGYFWASTATAAKSMANRLNQMLVANGGKIYMALVSSPADKLLSSTTAANGVVELFSSSALDRAIGISQSSVIDALANAAVVTSEKKIKKKDKNGNDVIGPDGKPVYITKNIGLNIKIPKSKVVDGKRVNATIEDIKAKISDKLSAENSTFEDRKVFSTAFITNIVEAIKGKKAEQILGQFFDKGILNTSFQQQGKIENKYNLSKANVIQSVSEMLSEPMLKGTKSGQVYAILEIDGQVEPIESNKHESYPMAIRSKEGNKTTLHILQNREDWSTRFADPETGETVTEDRLLNVFPTSGVSSEALTVLPKIEEGIYNDTVQWQLATQADKNKRTDTASEKLKQLFNRKNIPLSISEAKDIIKEVIDWTTWYDGISEYVKSVFNEYAEDVLSLLPLSSMANNSAATVGLAINNVEKIYKGEKPSGVAEYYGYVTDFLKGKGIESDKMYNFFKALSGDKNAIAVDMHVWSIIMGKDPNKKQVNPKNKAEFDRAKEFVNIIANELGLAPREVQAALWAANILRTGGKPDSYEQYIEKQVREKGLKERIEGWREKGYKPFSEVRKAREAVRAEGKEPVAQFQMAPIKWEKSKEGKGDPSISARNPIVLEAAKNLKQGKITNEEYRATVSENSPITPITRFFEPATEQEIRTALNSNRVEKVNSPIQDNTVVGSRLDIPSYRNKNTWVVSVHEGDTDNGAVISYTNVARLTDVRFSVKPNGALGIAAGVEKTTIGRMFGKWQNIEGATLEEQGENAKKIVQDIVNNPKWVQVGMNPFRHSYFYDRSSDMGRPIVRADEVIQIGGLVYAKNPTYGQWTDEAYTVKGLFDAAGAPVQFQMAAPTRSKMQAVKETLPLGNKLSPAQLEKLAKGVTLWQQWATSYGILGKEAKVAEEYKVGYVSQELYKADKAVKNVVKEIERAKKSGFNVTDEDITRFLTGQRAPAGTQPYSVSMPNYLKRALTVMRIHIDSMTEEMILNGVINDPVEVQEFRNNKGKYLGRFYDMFINGKGLTLNNIVEKLKDVDETVIEKARDLIRSEVTQSVTRANPTLTQDELDRVIENEVDDVLNRIVEDIANPYVKRPMKGSVNMKQLMERQNIVEPIRALMGEVTNPVSRYYATIGKMSSIVAGMKYLNEIRQIGMGKFLFEQNDPNRPKGTVRISSDTNKNLLPLAGLYTFPEIRDEFANYMVYQNTGANLLNKAMGTAKYMNTVGNLPTHIKNFASNIGILVNNGYIFDATNAIQFIINEPKAFEKAYEELRKSGTLNNNINATELRTYFQDNNDIDKVLSNKFKKGNAIKKIGKGLTDLYNLEDDVFKVIAYIAESQRYSKALYGVEFSQLSNTDKDNVSKKTVEIVKSILPLYSRVPPFIKGMNKMLYLGSFMSFTAESIRVSKNTILLALRELGDPKTRYIGAKRLGGVVAWNTAYGWGTTTSAAAVGSMATGAFTYWINAVQQLLSDDDEENKKRAQKEQSIRRVVRDFNISSDIYPTQANNGKLVYYDIGSVNPYNFVSNFLNRLDQLTKDDGEGIVMDIFRAIGHSFAPFVKQDFIASRLLTAYEALSGGRIPQNSYGKEIYRNSDPAFEKGKALAAYVGDVFTPGMVRNMWKAKEMVKEGNVEGAKAEVVSTLTIRKNVIDGERWFYGRIKSGATPYFKDIDSYSKEYSSLAYKNVPDSEKDAVYLENAAKIKKLIYETALDYKAAIDIGVEEGKLFEALSKAGYSDWNIAAILETVNGAQNIDNQLFLMRRH